MKKRKLKRLSTNRNKRFDNPGNEFPGDDGSRFDHEDPEIGNTENADK